MNDPGLKPVTVKLMGEDLPLNFTRRGLRRAEYESRTPLFVGEEGKRFWKTMADGYWTPFQVVVLMYAALCHLNRFTFEEVDEAMVEEDFGAYIIAIGAALARDFPNPEPMNDDPAPEATEAAPFVPQTTTG